jgi:hypothetical protein
MATTRRTTTRRRGFARPSADTPMPPPLFQQSVLGWQARWKARRAAAVVASDGGASQVASAGRP